MVYEHLLAVRFAESAESACSVYTVPAKACTSVMPVENGNRSEESEDLKQRVRAFWQTHPCGTKFSDAEIATGCSSPRLTLTPQCERFIACCSRGGKRSSCCISAAATVIELAFACCAGLARDC